MKLVERHIIKKGNEQYKIIDHACFLSKNLYNAGLYHIKQEFLKSGKWIRYNDMDKHFKLSNQTDYRTLTNNTSQQILMLLDQNLKSYFQAIKSWKRDKKKFTGCPVFPKYKDKIKGRNLLVYTYVQIGYKDGYITFPKKEGLQQLKTNIPFNQIKQIRIVPQSSCYVIEVVYNIPDIIKENYNENYLAIDLGINNLATCVTTNNQSFLINGKPIKAINQYYNKKLASLKSNLKKNHNKNSSNATKQLTFKRNNKIQDYMHKSSKTIINYCLKNNIDNIIIGKNDGWKQDINIGDKNNQNFVSIPFDKFINQLEYKGIKYGLKVKTINEAYTSKCSALDLESIQKHDSYKGKRIKRGLFRTANKRILNADVNGALNIMRKGIQNDEFIHLSGRGFVYNPVKINLNK